MTGFGGVDWSTTRTMAGWNAWLKGIICPAPETGCKFNCAGGTRFTLMLGQGVGGAMATVLRPVGSSPAGEAGETASGHPAMPVILSVNQSTVTSDANGLTSITPSVGSFTGALEVDVSVTTGSSASLLYILEAMPLSLSESSPGASPAPRE
jgi:hypothetical protein